MKLVHVLAGTVVAVLGAGVATAASASSEPSSRKAAVSDITRHYSDAVSVPKGRNGSATATCPAGKVALGGGARAGSDFMYLNGTIAEVVNAQSWTAKARNSDTAAATLTAMVICGTP